MSSPVFMSSSLLQLFGSPSGKLQEGKVQRWPPMHAAVEGSAAAIFTLLSPSHMPPRRPGSALL